MSFRKLKALLYKDITLFFKGRRKLRRKAQVLYFISIALVNFFFSSIYGKFHLKTALFLLQIVLFSLLLMSFIFELKHFVFVDEDLLIVKRLPVRKVDYFFSKVLFLLIFLVLFSLVITFSQYTGAYFLVRYRLDFSHLFSTMFLNSAFAISFAMFLYALLLRIFKNFSSADIVARVQIAFGVLFGLIFALAPKLEPVIEWVENHSDFLVFPFSLLPFPWFIRMYFPGASLYILLISVLWVVLPGAIGLLLGFEEPVKEGGQQFGSGVIGIVKIFKKSYKRAIFSLILSHFLRSRISKKTLLAPLMINFVVLIAWTMQETSGNLLSFGIWTILFLSIVISLGISISDSWRASWIFKRIPVPLGEVLVFSLDIAFLLIGVPYVIFVGFLLVLKGLPLSLIFLSLLYGLFGSYFIYLLLFLTRPILPFSKPGYERGIASLRELFISFMLTPFVAMVFNLLYSMGLSKVLNFLIGIFFIGAIVLRHIIRVKFRRIG